MSGELAIILHAHLPFVRHPEHARFLEEHWLFEAITECYLPLIRVFDGWLALGMDTRLTLTLSPTLCAMLRDDLLRDRYAAHLDGLIELAEKEIHRTQWQPEFRALAESYHEKFLALRATWQGYGRDVVGAFRKFQEAGKLEIITTAATHALLPLLAEHPPSARAQIFTAREHYEECFGRPPRGFWLPECAYAEGIETALQAADIRWFIMDTHGLLHATPRPRYGVFAPVFTANGLAAFGRDLESARQVWSRHEGYPGDARYRDFYRDIGYDLDLDYLRPHLPAPEVRSFTGLKYHAITGGDGEKLPYDRAAALTAAAEHAQHFLDARRAQARHLASVMERPPLLVAPYDAELFGHWWHEGPEFLDFLARKLVFDQDEIRLTTPQEFLERQPSHQIAAPAPSSWGEEGHLKVWLNETNEWIQPHLRVARERMSELARARLPAHPLAARARRQAGRELLLAQASDWPFILRTGTSPQYAERRVKEHLLNFLALHEMLTELHWDEEFLSRCESQNNLFPNIRPELWA